MRQFDVHRTTGRAREAAPYLVVVQSQRLDRMPTRVVVPLIPARGTADYDPDLSPRCIVDGETLVLAPWQIFTIPVSALGPVVMSFADDDTSARITRAIDTLISSVRR
jgi:toxin CcdB